jgi:glutamine synthetase
MGQALCKEDVSSKNEEVGFIGYGEKCAVEYIWLGGGSEQYFSNFDIRSKTKTCSFVPTSVDQLPVWNYDGSSTEQAPGNDSEVLIKPVAMFTDPFRGAPHKLVLCEGFHPKTKQPVKGNERAECLKVMEAAAAKKPWFGIEQEYTLFKPGEEVPLGFPDKGEPKPQGPYYCGSGDAVAFGRKIVEAHYKACNMAGLTIAGLNSEVMPGQWEYQVGPCEGIDSGDHMWVSRYIMQRVCEEHGVAVTFDPKPRSGDWNGAGCHTNFSTLPMRDPANAGTEPGKAYGEIIAAIEKLETNHQKHIEAYGKGNDRRLTGAHETAPIDKFSYGVANRGCSVRIPRDAEADQYGYFEDRRPASNMDPYIVTKMIVQTTCM